MFRDQEGHNCGFTQGGERLAKNEAIVSFYGEAHISRNVSIECLQSNGRHQGDFFCIFWSTFLFFFERVLHFFCAGALFFIFILVHKMFLEEVKNTFFERV